jgi:hypothetical protein
VDDVDLLAAAIQAATVDSHFDLNGDQTVDHADLKWLVEENLNRPLPDVNLDGRFDSSDLVRLFQVGKYETGEPALWSEGDLNGDGRFGSDDLMLAFANGYDAGDDD